MLVNFPKEFRKLALCKLWLQREKLHHLFLCSYCEINWAPILDELNIL